MTPVAYTRRWAYVPIGAHGTSELYGLEKDPYAEENIMDDNRETVMDLYRDMLAWLREIGAPSDLVEKLDRFSSGGE